MLSCEAVTLSVPGRVLCRNLSVRFGPAEVWAILGRNGTGKTTLVHALGGLSTPATGRVALAGRAVQTLHARERAREIGVVLQMEEGTFWGTVEEYVLLGRFPYMSAWSGYSAEDMGHARAALESLGMAELSRRRFNTLSGGERQRARIAQVFAQRPAVFLLDEPLQHLDLAHQAHVLGLLAERARTKGATIVMVMHEPFWIGHSCTHAVVLGGDGSAAAGRADEVLTRDRLERAYGCRLSEVTHGEGRSFVPDI
jgi:iron complex transport system ATP-binding protein